jgi:hypothetical protein
MTLNQKKHCYFTYDVTLILSFNKHRMLFGVSAHFGCLNCGTIIGAIDDECHCKDAPQLKL